MTVKDLIKKLQEYPQDLEVVVTGYEGGYNSVVDESIKIEKISRGESNAYEGEHAEIFEYSQGLDKKDIREVLYISR